MARQQRAGRGRRGQAWASPPGHAYLSVLLPAPAASLGLVPLMGGLAVAEALAAFGANAELKWPNDVLAGGRKLAGVLAEAVSSGAGVEWIVLGIGVNVAAELGPLGVELRERATSLAALTGENHDPLDVAGAVLARVRERHGELCCGGAGGLLDAWRSRSTAWWGRPVEVAAGGRLVRGIALDVDADGALLLRLADGGQVALVAGEARELRPAPAAAR